MKAIIFSDLHFNIWPKYPQRLDFQLSILEKMLQIGLARKVPVIFAGDLFHTSQGLENELMSAVLPKLIDLFFRYPVEFYAITGNHDVSKVNTYNRRSPSYIVTLSNLIRNFHVIDFDSKDFEDFSIYGVPYLHFNDGLMDYVNDIRLDDNQFNILLLHTDFKGQEDVNGIVIGKGEAIVEKKFERFDLVISGHVHLAGHIRRNIYSVGSPLQLRMSDIDGEMGYITLDDSFKIKYRVLEGPRYRLYSDEAEIENKTDYWIKESTAHLEDEELGMEIMDITDKKGIVLEYLKYAGIRSRSKGHMLYKLIQDEE